MHRENVLLSQKKMFNSYFVEYKYYETKQILNLALSRRENWYEIAENPSLTVISIAPGEQMLLTSIKNSNNFVMRYLTSTSVLHVELTRFEFEHFLH